MDNIINDLTCPITLELFEDPVRVPCCNKAFSRTALQQSLQRDLRCPMCMADINVDIDNLPKDIIIAGMVDTVQGRVSIPEQKEHCWECSVAPVSENSDIFELTLSVTDSKFSTRPSLFIAVLDRSGSMGGAPERQVSTALTHIYTLAQNNSCVKLIMISYGSDATVIDRPEDYRISGGTNFRAAFAKVQEVLRGYRCSDEAAHLHAVNNVCGVSVAFLTDGQDTSGNRERLVPEFKEMLEVFDGPLSVHAIGFSQGCDQNLLEGMREAGREPGMYRYAEPGDNDDALCNKLTGIFEVSSSASSVPITLWIPDVHGETEHEIKLNVDSKKYGEYRQWIGSQQIAGAQCVWVDSAHDEYSYVPIVKTDSKFSVTERWLGHLVDEMAGEILELSKSSDADIRVLHCALLNQRIEVIEDATCNDFLKTRLSLLKEQIDLLRCNAVVNVGKLNDAKYGSMAGSAPAPQTTYVSVPPPRTEQKVIADEPYNEQPLHQYSRNNKGKERTPLQQAIMNEVNQTAVVGEKLLVDLDHLDIDGNNALHLAAYCGHNTILRQLIETKHFDIDQVNKDNETATSLAIKARGFHRTLGVLLDVGAKIPRRKALERYALEHGFSITAKIVASYGDNNFEVDTTMTIEYINFTYERAMNSTDATNGIDAQQYLNVYLYHRDSKMAEEMILRHNAYPTINMLLDLCIPKKPDDPKTDEYIELATIMLNYAPELINEKNSELESPLFTAANRGSLPHVRFFISKGAKIDDPNELGNTPLWIAAYKRYPCIIDELLDEGADINHKNLKGNGPIYGVTERGLVKVAEQLMARGADLMSPNNNGDTYILLCCRNGQWEVLKFLLNYVTEEFVDFKAHIDGFNAIMASAEQNRAECIRVLFEYGVDIDQVTDDDNKILAHATPLHIASYYNRGDAVRMLLKLGADPNKADIGGCTPLHIAVIQGHVDIVRALRRGGADMTTIDSSGNSAQAYCRNRPELRKVLVNPALDILMKLAKGGFSNTKTGVEVLQKHSGVEGLTKKYNSVDIVGDDGTTPLQQAVIYSNFDMVQCLCTMGANKHNAAFWAAFTGNPRIRKLIGVDLDVVVQKNQLLFLGKPEYSPEVPSSIGYRMSNRINVVMYGEHPEYRKTIEEAPEHRFMRQEIKIPAKALWDARVFVAKFMYDHPDSHMSVEQLLALALYSNNPSVSDKINTELLNNSIVDYAKYVISALKNIEPYLGEVYMADPTVDRKLFEIGHEFTWPTFRSASSLWRVATENVEYFAAKARKGTVFAIRSKTGKHIGKYSRYGFDAEVLFTPYTRFRVKNWYRGDVIALGQANIREHTFSLEPEDMDRMRENNRSLIIELEEV